MSISQIQKVINRIREGQVSERELVGFLGDKRGLVRINALMAIPGRRFENPQLVVEAVLRLAFDSAHRDMRLLGAVTQKMFSLATLSWMSAELAKQAFESSLDRLNEQERERVLSLVQEGPVQ